AAACFRRTLELDPEFHPARLELAVQLLDLGRAGEAIPHLEYLRTKDPTNPRVPVYLAQGLKQVGRQTEAQALLDDAIARAPNFGPALAERGDLFLSGGKIEEAENLLSRATRLEPGDYATNQKRSQCLMQP